MKTIKVAEATGPALDWLVAKCEGLKLHRNALLGGQVKEGWWVSGYYMDPNNWIPLSLLNFSTDWAQGGPVIEREGINLSVDYQDDALSDDMVQIGWKGNLWNNSVPGTAGFLQWAYGPTPLIAAMRCYVTSKLGSEVEVPEELT